MTVVNLYPDNRADPHTWRSDDAADPEVVLLRRPDGEWAAKLERRIVAHADSAEQLAAHLFGEYDLMAVLNLNEPVEA